MVRTWTFNSALPNNHTGATSPILHWGSGIRTLHRIQSVALLLADQIHLAHISLADQLDLIEAAGSHLDISNLDGVGAVRAAEISHAGRLQRRHAIGTGDDEQIGIAVVGGLRIDQGDLAGGGILGQRLLAQFSGGRALTTAFALGEEALSIGRAGHSPQLASQFFFCCGNSFVSGCSSAVCLDRRRVWRARRNGPRVVVSYLGQALVCEVGIGIRRGTQGIVEGITLAGHGGGAVSTNIGEELGLAKGAFGFGLGCGIGLLAAVATAARAVDSKEVLELLREGTVARGGLAGRHRGTGKESLLAVERRGRRGG